jgi:hypothetical protein
MGYEMEYGMGTFGLWHAIWFTFWVALFLIPAWRIVQKAGFPGALSLLLLIPLVNIIMVWVFAFVRWPNQKAGT